MRRSIFLLIAAVFTLNACNNTEPAEQVKLDSIAESAAADSMLNAALEADTLKTDSASADSSHKTH